MKSEVKENNVDFSLIRYSQCWEDTEVLLSGLDIREGDICLGIASAGDNVFSMLTKSPEKIIAIDISFPQLALVKLKIEGIKQFSHEEMLFFVGVTNGNPERRLEMYEGLRGELPNKIKEYWDFNRDAIRIGINHMGKFEKFFKIFRNRILPMVHPKKRIDKLLENKSLPERQEFYNRKWCNLRWKLMFKLFFSNYVVGRLGRDKEFFRYAQGDISKVMIKRSEYALCHLNPYENPYISYILKGNYSPDCLPYFLRKENYSIMKENIGKIEVVEESLEEYLNRTDLKIDKFNLSDIFEYMSQENYEKLMDKIYDAASSKGKIAYWNLIVPRNSEIKNFGKGKFERLSPLDSVLHRRDKTFFYTDFVVEKVIKDDNS